MGKSNMLFDNLSKSQKSALARINKIRAKMVECWNSQDLFDLYCQADDIFNEFFPFQAQLLGDKWEVTRLYNDLDRAIRTGKEYVTINLFGKSLQVACA